MLALLMSHARERVEVVEWNKRWSPPLPCESPVYVKKTLIQKKKCLLRNLVERLKDKFKDLLCKSGLHLKLSQSKFIISYSERLLRKTQEQILR